MRILGSLRAGYKLVFLIFLIQVSFTEAWAKAENESKLVIRSHQDLILQAKKLSPEYQKIKNQFEVDSLNSQNLLSMYNWTLSAGLNSQDGELASTTPFAPSGERGSTTSSLRMAKNTAIGLDPFVEIGTTDVFSSFPNNGKIEYQTASLEVGFRLNLMKAIFAGSSSAVFQEKAVQDDLAILVQKNTDRDFSVKILKSYFQYLKSYHRLGILKTQCGEYKTLQKISSKRFKKKLIREKDFLSIEVLYQGCLLDKKTAQNNLAQDGINLIKVSGLPADTLVVASEAKFPKLDVLKSFTYEDNIDFQLAQKTLEASRAKASSLKSDRFPEFNFDYSLSSQSSEDGVAESLSEAAGFDLVTHNVGLNLKYEFGGSTAKINAKRIAAEERIKSLDLDQLKRSLERDTKRVTGNLSFLKDAHLSAVSLARLQKRKSKLFRRDFENGRGGIRDLVEAQINYLNSLERALDLEYNQTISKIDYYDLKGESLERFN